MSELVGNKELDMEQLKAVQHVIDNKITFISGKAGSGKSFTAEIISNELKNLGWTISKVAPTGKAALRIKGTTIHSWMQPKVVQDEWGNVKITGFNKETMNNKESLIVDECSMIDGKLWSEFWSIFLKSYGEQKIILIGDVGQLPPVEFDKYGAPFLEYIEKGENVIELKTIHRQKNGNDIILLANAIRDGITIDEELKNVKQISREDAINYALQDLEDHQIICPLKSGWNGVNIINLEMQNQRLEKLGEKIMKSLSWDNSSKRWIEDKIIHVGDKVMITKNYFHLDIINGTIGIAKGKEIKRMLNLIFNVYEPTLCFVIEINGIDYYIPLKHAQKTIDLAYAITVHKMQGSDCKNVYFMVTEDQSKYLDTKMLYTGVTRAKESLYIVK